MFAEMPLDNRTVDHSRPLPPSLAFSGRLKFCRKRNDVMFRRDREICNIEPKICQYA
jgi:hypothetical protein